MRDREQRLQVGVVGGGVNDEHTVSLASADAVERAVRELGHDVTPLTIGRDGSWWDGRPPGGRRIGADHAVAELMACDVVFPALHGVNGEDGAVAGLLTMLGVPFVGSPVRAGALGMDKWVTKLLADELGVRTAPGVLLRAVDDATRAGIDALGLPLVVKPTTGGSSTGVSVVRHRSELDAAVELALDGATHALAESFVSGKEVDIALFRDVDGALRAGSTLEIGVEAGGVFDAASKYDGSAHFTLPARIDDAEHEAVLAAAHTLYEGLGCDGVARFDFFVTADGVVFNEVNTMPGFTEQSQVPRMFAAHGMS